MSEETTSRRPAMLGPRFAPHTRKQFAQFDAGAAHADMLLDDPESTWLSGDAMIGRDRFWVHGYWARYHERVPVMMARLEQQAS